MALETRYAAQDLRHAIFGAMFTQSLNKRMEIMTPNATKHLLQIKKEAINGMVSYMQFGGAEDANDPDYDPDFDAGYSQKDIDRCAKILDQFLAKLAEAAEPNRNANIRKTVKTAVLALNKLNETCDGGLIETDQREQICDLLLSGAKYAGLAIGDEDITEEWRAW